MQAPYHLDTRLNFAWKPELPAALNASHHALFASPAGEVLRRVVEESITLDYLEEQVRRAQEALSMCASDAVSSSLTALSPGHQTYWRRVLSSGEALTAILAWQDALTTR